MSKSPSPLLFGVLSDLHLTDPALGPCGRSELFRTALERFRDRGVDAVLVCGDLTDIGFTTELEEVARVWFAVFPGGRLPDALDTEPPSCVFSRAELAAPGPLRFTVAPANAWGQEGRECHSTVAPCRSARTPMH